MDFSLSLSSRVRQFSHFRIQSVMIGSQRQISSRNTQILHVKNTGRHVERDILETPKHAPPAPKLRLIYRICLDRERGQRRWSQSLWWIVPSKWTKSSNCKQNDSYCQHNPNDAKGSFSKIEFSFGVLRIHVFDPVLMES